MELVPVSISKNKSPVVAHSNQLTEARYSLSVAEQRLVLTLLSFISPTDEDFKDYEIKISDFKNMLDINTNAVYDQTKEVLKRLASRVIYIPDGKDYLIANWFSSARYNSEKGSVYISFDKNLKPYLLQLKEQFTRYRLFVIAQFKSSYTIRIYMLLKQYETIGFREIDLKDIRDILDIKDKEYLRYADFKKRVLDQAKKEFETKNKETGGYMSDITFDLETIRTGRKITRLRFNIKKQSYQERLPIDLPDAEVKAITPAREALEQYNIRGNIAEKYLDQQDEAEILRCVAILEHAKQGGKVKSSDSGYLLTLLEKRAGQKSQAEEQAEQEKAQKEAKALQAKQRKAEQEQREKLSLSFDKIAIPEFLATLSDEEHAELLRTVKAENPENASFISGLDKGIGRVAVKSKITNYEARKEVYIKENLT